MDYSDDHCLSAFTEQQDGYAVLRSDESTIVCEFELGSLGGTALRVSITMVRRVKYVQQHVQHSQIVLPVRVAVSLSD